MPVTLLPEDRLSAALLRHRVDPDAFEAAVRALLAKCEDAERSTARLSSVLRGAAAFLPAGFLAPAPVGGAAVKMAPVTGIYKGLGYLAFPAISLFLLAGAALFSVATIRKLRMEEGTDPGDDAAIQASARQWWHEHRWGGRLVFVASAAMSWFGATWLLFLLYIVSFGLLLYVLSSLAKAGLANRLSIGPYCVMGLGILGQLAGFAGVGDSDIHLLDQRLIVLVFFWGALTLALLPAVHGSSRRCGRQWFPVIGMLMILIPLTAWFTNQFYWPATPARIKAYVESFDRARFSTASWSEWEIVARWTVDAKLAPDMTRPRRLLTAEIDGKQNPFVLGDAFRTGLVKREDTQRLRDYKKRRDDLLNQRYLKKAGPILSLNQADWVIRAAVMLDDLNVDQKVLLAKRLDATVEREFTTKHAELETVLRATQLFEVIGHPVEPDLYRDQVHALLLRFHTTRSGGFQLAGGFRKYESGRVGDLNSTAYAVELMGVYGIPDGLDMNWVRSYLRPLSFRSSPKKWIAAVSLDRLNQLPGVTRPTLLEALYYERSLLAAAVLVGLCIYATVEGGPSAQAGLPITSMP